MLKLQGVMALECPFSNKSNEAEITYEKSFQAEMIKFFDALSEHYHLWYNPSF